MKESEPRKIAPHLITDTGVWRLTVEISEHTLQAWLRRNDDPDDPVYYLAGETWTGEDSLRNVENAVYDHPLVLDDFEADIIITTPKFLFLPAEAGNDSMTCRNAYSMVFGETADDEIFVDRAGEYLCVYMLMPGLKPFLSRSFAGSRISSHISLLIRHWERTTPEGRCIFADISKDTIDIGAFADGKLVNAARHKWTAPDDILYYIANSARVFGNVRLDTVSLYVSGERKDVCEALAPYMLTVDETLLPGKDRIPLPALLCSYRKPIRQ